ESRNCRAGYLQPLPWARGVVLLHAANSIPGGTRACPGCTAPGNRRRLFCVPALTRDPWLDPLRTQAGLQDLLQRAQARHREALIAFNAEGGDRVLGVS